MNDKTLRAKVIKEELLSQESLRWHQSEKKSVQLFECFRHGKICDALWLRKELRQQPT